MNELHFFGGYVWYAYPVVDDLSLALLNPPQGKACFHIKDFVGVDGYSNFKEEGLILVTDNAKRPYTPFGWGILPLNVPDGFGGKVSKTEFIRHIYTTEKTTDSVFSFFVKVTLKEN